MPELDVAADSAAGRERILDPLSRVSEILFGLIMALTFTCTLSATEGDREEVRTVLFGAIACNVAWGIVDGAMYLINILTSRGREAMLAGGGSAPALTRRDWAGAVAVFLLVFFSTFPIVIPFAVFRNYQVAMRASNGIAIVMLFTAGFTLARYGGFGPWRTGLSMVVLGVVLVAITIALGG